jgi:hypothetical protein
VSERHHQQHQRCEADARVQQLRQEVDKLDVFNMERLHVESEALDLRVSGPPPLSKTTPPAGPPPVQVLLEARQPRQVRDHLDSLIVLTTSAGTDDEPGPEPLELVGQGGGRSSTLPLLPVTQDLPPMLLKGVRVIAGSVTPGSTSAPSFQPGTRPSPLPIPVERLQEIQEGILQHNLKCRDVQAHLNRKRQQLHRVAVRYGLSTNQWTAIVLMIPVLLFEAG